MRHLFEHLDVLSTGPTVDAGDLSVDQQYLFDICQEAITGKFSDQLSHRQPGKLVVSRWLTLRIRVLRLYIATKNPSYNLRMIAEFVVKVYAPIWFAIKTKPSCKDGSRHLWLMIHKSRYLPQDLLDIIDPVIQRNAYFGHPENILLTMITDDQQHVRELGLRRTLSARSSTTTTSEVRVFEVPPLNFQAEDYIDLINWQDCIITEPPFTKTVTDDDLQNFISNRDSPAIDFPRYPCHTQAVERCVKSVTEHARDGFIRSRIKARAIMPTFETKKEYRTTL